MNKDVQLSTFGTELVVLYRRTNLSQGEFASAVGISSVALRKWESGQSCPKTESLKRAIEILIHKGAFKQGAEQTEARYLWELAMQKGLKIPFDEVWFLGIMPRVSVEVVSNKSVEALPNKSVGADSADLVLYADLNPASPRGLTLFPARTRGRRKRLLAMLIALVILLIIGSAGTFFFYARGYATDQTYPGYLAGHGTLAFFDPLSQERGSQWGAPGDNSAVSCQFTGRAYHVSAPMHAYLDVCPGLVIASNFAFEVQLTIIQGSCGGLLFRDDGQAHYYYFSLCADGLYMVVKGSVAILYSGKSSAIHTGLGQQNKLAVVANGNTMIFYVNEQQINLEHDSSYTSGKMVFIAYGDNGPTDVAFSNARLWTL